MSDYREMAERFDRIRAERDDSGRMVTGGRLAARSLFDTLNRYRARIPFDVMYELSGDCARLIAALDISMVDVIRDSKLSLHDSTRR